MLELDIDELKEKVNNLEKDIEVQPEDLKNREDKEELREALDLIDLFKSAISQVEENIKNYNKNKE